MHLRENEFDKAHTDFFEAFINYDESGSPRRTTCLKYLVLANMLMKSGKLVGVYFCENILVCQFKNEITDFSVNLTSLKCNFTFDFRTKLNLVSNNQLFLKALYTKV